MINPQWLELPISRTNFHGPKDVRATEVRLYNDQSFNDTLTNNNNNVSFVQLGPGILEAYNKSEGSNQSAHPSSQKGVIVDCFQSL